MTAPNKRSTDCLSNATAEGERVREVSSQKEWEMVWKAMNREGAAMMLTPEVRWFKTCSVEFAVFILLTVCATRNKPCNISHCVVLLGSVRLC